MTWLLMAIQKLYKMNHIQHINEWLGFSKEERFAKKALTNEWEDIDIKGIYEGLNMDKYYEIYFTYSSVIYTHSRYILSIYFRPTDIKTPYLASFSNVVSNSEYYWIQDLKIINKLYQRFISELNKLLEEHPDYINNLSFIPQEVKENPKLKDIFKQTEWS